MDSVFTSFNLQPHPPKSLSISGAILTIPALFFRARPCSPPLLPSSFVVPLLALVVGADTGEGGTWTSSADSGGGGEEADGQRRGAGWLKKEVAGGLGSSAPTMTLASCRSRSSPCSFAPRIHHSLSSASLAMHEEAPSWAMDTVAPCSPLSRRPSQTSLASTRWTCSTCSDDRKLKDGAQGGVMARQRRRSSSDGRCGSDQR
jgi:hypothetical protein